MEHSIAQPAAAAADLQNALKVKEKDKLNATLTTLSITAQLHRWCGCEEINNDGQNLARCSRRWPQKWLRPALGSPAFRAGLEGNRIAWDQLLIWRCFAFRHHQFGELGVGRGQGPAMMGTFHSPVALGVFIISGVTID